MSPSEQAAGGGRRFRDRMCVAVAAGCIAMTMLAAAAATAHAEKRQLRIEYAAPRDPAHQPLYELLQERRVLEGVQKIFSPFLLPVDLKIRVAGCDGMVNAFYWKQEITICYEYLDEIRQSIPRNMSMGGISSADAVIGQFFYVAAHEMGHAVFDVLRVPVFGREEDAADHFAVYMMLQFGREESRRLIAGAASAYDQYLARPTTFLRLEAFSGVHGLPMQRFFNLMCIAYGADAKLFADAVEKGYLPRNRANVCRREYRQLAFAFQQTLGPHLDRDLMKEVMSNSWLPPPDAPSSEEDESLAPQGVKGEARRGTP